MSTPRRRTVRIAVPSAPASLDPLEWFWEEGTDLIRCHPRIYDPGEFYAGRAGAARFSAFTPEGPSHALPVLYAASTTDGALSETVLRDVPVHGKKHLSRAQAQPLQLSSLRTTRPLRLADFTSVGLRRLRLSRQEMIESDRRFYSETATWARAIHAHVGDDDQRFDGIVWVSRQHDTSEAVVLFGDRFEPGDLILHSDPPQRPLAFGAGRELLNDICDRADITVVDP